MRKAHSPAELLFLQERILRPKHKQWHQVRLHKPLAPRRLRLRLGKAMLPRRQRLPDPARTRFRATVGTAARVVVEVSGLASNSGSFAPCRATAKEPQRVPRGLDEDRPRLDRASPDCQSAGGNLLLRSSLQLVTDLPGREALGVCVRTPSRRKLSRQRCRTLDAKQFRDVRAACRSQLDSLVGRTEQMLTLRSRPHQVVSPRVAVLERGPCPRARGNVDKNSPQPLDASH